jgi:hypothetical protein
LFVKHLLSILIDHGISRVLQLQGSFAPVCVWRQYDRSWLEGRFDVELELH